MLTAKNELPAGLSWEDLAKLPRWVAWRQESTPGKPRPTKPPYTSNGRKADVTNPECWTDLATAMKWCEEIKGDGVGFMLGPDERLDFVIFGVDCDCCRNPLLDLSDVSAIDPFVYKALQALGSYCEVSPSLTGVKLFGLCRLSDLDRVRKMLGGSKWSRIYKRGGGDHPPSIETYFGGRYFTVTRNHLPGTPSELHMVSLAALEQLLLVTGPQFVGRVISKSKGDDSDSGVSARFAVEAYHKHAMTEAEWIAAMSTHSDAQIVAWYEKYKDEPGQRQFHRAWDYASKHNITIGGGGYQLLVNSKGKVEANIHNLTMFMHQAPEWAGLFARNSETYEVCAIRPPPMPPGFKSEDVKAFPRLVNDNDVTLVLMWMELNRRLKFTNSMIEQAIQTVAAQNTFAPIGDYLREVASQYDLDDNMMHAFHYAFKIKPTELNRRIFQDLVVAAVRRKLQPDPYKYDSCVVLFGPQGIYKSGFWRTLFGQGNYTDNIQQNLGDKDARAQVSQCWCVEFAEVEMLERSSHGAAKAFISSEVDFFRPAYGRTFVKMTRRSVLVGTTNDPMFLRDQTGNRRFPTIDCSGAGPIDLAWVEANRDRIWAHAYHLALDPEVTTYFEPDSDLGLEAASIQEKFIHEDIWESKVDTWLNDKGVTASNFSLEALMNCLGLNQGEQARYSPAIAKALKHIGYINAKISKTRVKRWFAPGATLPNGAMVPRKEDDLPPSPEPPKWMKPDWMANKNPEPY